MSGNQGCVDRVENRIAVRDATGSSNSLYSIYFDGPKSQHHTNGSQTSSTVASCPFAECWTLIDHDVHSQVDTVESHPELWWNKIPHTCQDAFSGFFGVFILMLFGDGVVAQVVFSSEQKGEYYSKSWGEFHHP